MTKGEDARSKFSSLYKDDKTGEEGDPQAGDDGEETEESGDVGECIADIEAALSRLKSKVGSK